MVFRFRSAPTRLRRIGAASIALSALALACVPAPAAEAVETGFVRRTFRDDAGEHGYVVYVPPEYRPDRDWPVMLFLHGAGERGRDGFRQAEIGLGAMIRRWDRFPWIVVFPQAEDTRGPIKSVWSPDAPDGKRALAILEEVERAYRVDSRHRALTGWSMGGRGAYMLAAYQPDRWSAVLPIAGWADPALAAGLAKVPLWSFHGTADTLVSFEEDAALIEAVRDAGGEPFFTVMPDEGHYIWRSIYASPVVFEWLSDPARFAGRKEPPAIEPLASVELPLGETGGPFVPAIEIDNAVAIRIGPDLFRDLSAVAEEEIARQPMIGGMPPTSTEATEACITFDVRASRLSYRVPVTDVEIAPTDSGTLLLRLAVSDARIVIGRTDVRGGLCAATAGPMCAVLGHRQPIPVEVEAVPYATGNEFRLRTKTVRFQIPRGNWYVTKPNVDSHSLLLPAGRVAQSLVEGVYSSKSRIERDFRKSVADAIDELRLELPSVTDDQLLTALWPVPAYRPRIRPRLEKVEVSGEGLAVVFGLTVAAVDPFAPPAGPKRIDFGITSEHVAQGDLAVTAAENLVAPLTAQLIDAGLAHVNVADIPDGSYGRFADRNELSRAIPALRNLPPSAEIRTELYLRQPLGLGDTEAIEQVCTPDGCFSVFDLRMPDLTALVSVRDSADQEWRDFAEFSYDVTQPIRLGLGNEAEKGREIVSTCLSSALVRTTARWLTPTKPEDDRLDIDAATRLFEQGWAESTQSCRSSAFVVPDIDLRGYVRRLDRLEAGTRGMSAVFEEPETVISNQSELPLIYRTRRAGAAWEPLITLPPGERHPYRVSRPLGYESEAGGGRERYDIPPGRDAVFKPMANAAPGLVLEPLPTPPERQGRLPGTGG